MASSTVTKSIGVVLGLGKKGFLIPTSVISRRGIAGKALRQGIERPKPWPYERWEFNTFWYAFFLERTTPRFDENSKLIVVDGVHSVGKSQFAKELAEELDMKYFPQINMDTLYVSPYGNVDRRDYNEYYLPRNKTFDEKDFFRNPMGTVPGSCDRFMLLQYFLKYKQYVEALCHLFNTGQGVVVEKNPHSHYAEVDAAFNAGWIKPPSMKFMAQAYYQSLHLLLRPNLIIYLDAPIDTVRKNIAARGNEWDKDSPVWNHPTFLEDVYTEVKKNYLKKAREHSQVLVYDWSEPGETEVVVEDIERMNFDHYGLYDPQQSDWRFRDEDLPTALRVRYSGANQRAELFTNILLNTIWDAEEMWLTAEELINLQEVASFFPGNQYAYGFNPDMGDNVWFKFNTYGEAMNQWLAHPPDELFRGNPKDNHYLTPK